jgi:putative peptide zinc metalloprotease protein
VQVVWDSLLETLEDNAPTQDEIIRLLTELDQRDLMRYEAQPNIRAMFRRKKQKKKAEQRSTVNPFAMKMSLWDPSGFLDRLGWLQSLIFNPWVFLLWLIIFISALLSASTNWEELHAHFASHMSTPRYLFLAWISFPFIKALHELGHAMAVRHWGGQVTETGITLFLLTPAPYVDASAASAFRRPIQRVVVGATGLMVELLLAAIALLVWYSSQPGFVQDLAFVIMFVCSVSTLLFNGNPLLRFDAYYILCDVFDLPNLATRSRAYWTNKAKRLVLGKKSVIPMHYALGERKWLVAYAPLSIFYTLFIVSYVVLWLGAQSFIVGIVGGLVMLGGMIVKPMYSMIKNILASAPLGAARFRAKVAIASSLGGLVVLLTLIPVPFSTTAQGVVWIPDEALVRAESEGFIKEIRVYHGDPVEPGQVLVVLDDPELTAERDKKQKQVEGLRTEQFNQLFQDPSRAMSIGEKIDSLNAEIARLNERLAGLLVRSKAGGYLVMPHQYDMPGTFVKKGALLGFVLNQDAVNVRVAVPEPDAELLHDHLRNVQVRIADRPDEAISAQLISDNNSVTHSLPSPALADRNGGRYPTDPADKDGLTATEPFVLIDLKLPSIVLERVGTRAIVRFDHGNEPVVQQVYRKLRQVFLRYFNAST